MSDDRPDAEFWHRYGHQKKKAKEVFARTAAGRQRFIAKMIAKNKRDRERRR